MSRPEPDEAKAYAFRGASACIARVQRRILRALAVARTQRPGVATSTLEMIEAGWPGEKMQHGAATMRVYTTIRRLRGLGLADALVTREDGYLIDREVPPTLG